MKKEIRKNKLIQFFKIASNNLNSLWLNSNPKRFSADQTGLESWKSDVGSQLGIKDEESLIKILSGEILPELVGSARDWSSIAVLFPRGEEIRRAWKKREDNSLSSFLDWIKSRGLKDSGVILGKILEENKSLQKERVTLFEKIPEKKPVEKPVSSPGKNLGDQKLALIKEVEPAVKKISERYNIPEGIIFAQWALESAYGTKDIGGYNYFGMKGVGTAGSTHVKTKEEYQTGNVTTEVAGFKKFNNPEEGFDAYGKLLSGSGNFGYATEAFKDDPAKFAIWIWGNSYATSSKYPISLATTAKSIGTTLGRGDIGWDYTPEEMDLIQRMTALDPGKERKELVKRELGPKNSSLVS
jgi:hypothetical protein